MKAGKKILIAAHGNSLRGIVKHLDGKEKIWTVILILYYYCMQNTLG